MIKSASRLVTKGRTCTLGLPIMHAASGGPSYPERVPPVHVSLFSKSTLPDFSSGDDYLVLNSHNGPSHMDALAHFWMGERLYNNFPADDLTSAGTKRCGIDKVGAIFTLGVLLDIARYKGVH